MRHQSGTIKHVDVQDIRFHFAEGGLGSDAANPQTDYSNPLITITTDGVAGVGIGFSLGRGNEQICRAAEELSPLLIGKNVGELVADFGNVWRELANPLQSRWIAPGAGPYHMAGGALTNAVFDAWAKARGLPLWKALCSLEAEEVLAMLDFRYVEHVLTKAEAQSILESVATDGPGTAERIAEVEAMGMPCYHTTWIGSGTEELLEQIDEVCNGKGTDAFKLKVGRDLKHDRQRLSAIRDRFGAELALMVDANQVWSVPQAIEWMTALSDFDLEWIEEPTAPDLIDGHRIIREGIADTGIHVVAGENCPNSHVAAQLISQEAVDRFQIDACRVMGPPEVILIMLIAAKYGVAICPHAGGSGLDELVPHLAAFNEVSIAPGNPDAIIEQVGFCADYFVAPSTVTGGRVHGPQEPGYIVGMKPEAAERFRFPDGPVWAGGDKA